MIAQNEIAWPLDAKHVVVFVDDEQPVLDALARLLRHEPYEVLTFRSPQEALRRLERGDVSLLVADQRMPEMSGTELLRAARRRFPQTPRAMLTAYADFDAVTQAVNEAGIQKYLRKPWDDEQFKDVLRRLLVDEETESRRRRALGQMEQTTSNMGELVHGLQTFLKKQTRSLRTCQEILDMLPLPVAVFVPEEGHLTYANRPFVRLWGGRKSLLVGCRPESIFPNQIVEAMRRLTCRRGEQFIEGVRIFGASVGVWLRNLPLTDPDSGILIQIEL
jgi:FixJ family two-component response regulator